MLSARESRALLLALSGKAVDDAMALLASLGVTGVALRAQLLDLAPSLVAAYSDGSSALAADSYAWAREAAGAPGYYSPEPVVANRLEKIRNGIAWASDPALSGVVGDRLSTVVQSEVTRPYRDTMLANRRRDPAATGWRRVADGGCGFCRMLADKGAVYRESTVRFAAHDHCNCTAWPAFVTNDDRAEASVLQYVASKRRRSPTEKERLRAYLAENYPA